jgi:hypothetical protein
MTAIDGRRVGGSLASSVACNLTAQAAVDEWVMRYPAMRSFDYQHVWFRPLIDTIAQRRLESVSWGVKLRLGLGSAFSILDLVTDIAVTYRYFRDGNDTAAMGMVSMLLVGFSLQFVVILLQHGKEDEEKRKRKVLREVRQRGGGGGGGATMSTNNSCYR